MRHGVPQGSVLGPLFFRLYINELPKVISDICKPILYADDTSIVIFDKDSEKFKFKINTAFDRINKWFQSNFLSLNFEKTEFLQFLTKNSHEIDIQVSYDNNKIDNTYNIKFLGLIVDTFLSWKNHIDQLVCKLNKSCYLMRSIKPFLSLAILKMVYFSYAHYLLTYGIIFWGNSTHSKVIFKIQKRIIRIMTDSGSRASCRALFKALDILPLQSQYIYSISVFAVMNRDLFVSNYDIHNSRKRQIHDLHMPASKLFLFQMGVYYSGNKIFNHLPSFIKNLASNVKIFKTTLKNFLMTTSFYTADEFFNGQYN
jgi:hypothetical protein